ncbi:MAG: hypothetical protein Q7T14_12640 [Aestuariivirga sp.]|nr:hypothetical protein [Aestuariivirga sp.]
MAEDSGVVKKIYFALDSCAAVCLIAVFALTLLVVEYSSEARAQEPAPLTQKAIRIFTTGTPGGASDQFARVFAKALERDQPGASVIVQNLRSKGNVVVIKDVFESGSREINLTVISAGVIFDQLSKGDKLPFDLSKMPAIGSFTSSNFLLGVGPGADWDFKKPRAAQPQLRIAVHYRSASDYFFAVLLNAVTNLNILPAEGFETDVMKTMFLAGDLNAIMLSGTDPEAGLVESGDMKPVLLVGTTEYPKAFSGAARLADVVDPKADQEVVKTVQQVSDFGRLLLAAPKTSVEALDALRAAFLRISADPVYRSELEAAGLVSVPRPGDQVDVFLKHMLGEGSSLRPKIAAAMDCGRKVADDNSVQCFN